MKRLTAKGQEKLFNLLSKAFEIYNGFAPGKEGEQALLKLRDEVHSRLESGTNGTSLMKLELPLSLVAYMMAAAKHLGDMCMTISRMDKAGTLFRR